MKLFFPFFTLVGLIFSTEPSQARASIHIGASFGVPAPVVSYPAPYPTYPSGYYAPPAPAPYYYYPAPVVMLPPPPVMVMSPFAPPLFSVGVSSSSKHGHHRKHHSRRGSHRRH